MILQVEFVLEKRSNGVTTEELLELENRVKEGYKICRKEAVSLVGAELSELAQAADRIRLHF